MNSDEFAEAIETMYGGYPVTVEPKTMADRIEPRIKEMLRKGGEALRESDNIIPPPVSLFSRIERCLWRKK